MADEFFQQLIDCMKREAKRHPGHLATEETLRAFMAETHTSAGLPEAASPSPAPAIDAAPGPAIAKPVRPAPAVAAPEGSDTVAGAGSLDELRKIVLQCRNCRLAPTRHSVVFGEWNPHARLMFVWSPATAFAAALVLS